MLKVAYVLITGVMSYYGYQEHPPYKGFDNKTSCEIAGRNFSRPFGGKVVNGKWFPYAGYRCVSPWPNWQTGRDAPLPNAINCESDQSGKPNICCAGSPPAHKCDYKKFYCTRPDDITGYGY